MSIRLRIVRGGGAIHDIELPFGTYVIGRDVGDIVLNDPLASGSHARIDAYPRGVTVTDLGSSNGTFDSEGRPVSATTNIQLGQSIRIGNSSLTLTGFLAPPAGGTLLGTASAVPAASAPIAPALPLAPPHQGAGGYAPPPVPFAPVPAAQPPRGALASGVKPKGAPAGLILALAGLMLVAAAVGSYFAFFRGVSSKLSGSVPKDVQVFVEVPSIPAAIESFAAMGILDSEKVKGEEVAEKVRKELERAFELEKDDAAALMSSVESVAIAARKVTTNAEVVVLLNFSASAGVEALLKSDRFDEEGDLAGGKQYSLERTKLDNGELMRLPSHRRALALLEVDEDSGIGALVWFADEKILVFGTKDLVKDVGGVIVEGDAALEQTDKWGEATFPHGAAGIAFVDSEMLDDIDGSLETIVEDYFHEVGPFTASMRFVDAGSLVTMNAEMKGKKVGAENAMPAAVTLDLYKKLPKETVAYLAFSTKREGTAREFLKRALADAESIDAAGAKRLESVLDAMEEQLGSSDEEVIDLLGDQAVIAVAREGDIGGESTDSEQWIEKGGIALLLRVADEDKAKTAAAELEKKNLHDVIVHHEDGHLLVAVGGMKKRFVAALEEGKDTLADDDAHDSALDALDGKPTAVGWIDTARFRKSVIDVVGKPQVDALEDDLGVDLDAIRVEGDDRITSMVGFTFETGAERWGIRVELLNYAAGMAALTAMLESAPSVSLTGILAKSEADQFSRDMERFADEMCACEDGACRQKVMLAMGAYDEEVRTKHAGGPRPEPCRVDADCPGGLVCLAPAFASPDARVCTPDPDRAVAAMSRMTTCMRSVPGQDEKRDDEKRDRKAPAKAPAPVPVPAPVPAKPPAPTSASTSGDADDEILLPGKESLLTKVVCSIDKFGHGPTVVSPNGFLMKGGTHCGLDGKVQSVSGLPGSQTAMVAVAADGGLIYTNIAKFKGWIHKIRLDGTAVWTADDSEGRINYGRPPRASTFDGGERLFAIASATQLPGEAPELADLPVIVQLDAMGKQRWVKRVPREFDQELSEGAMRRAELAADASGNLFVASEATMGAALRLSRFDDRGESSWMKQHDAFYLARMRTRSSVVRVSPNGAHVFVATEKSLAAKEPGAAIGVHGGASAIRVLKSDRDGKVVWYKNLIFSHTTLLDPVEKAEWIGGHPNSGWQLLAGDDGSLCWVGDYYNQFRNGSSPRKNYTALLVACFDAGGSLKWSRQYRVGPTGDGTKEERNLHFAGAGWVAPGRLGVIGNHTVIGEVRETKTVAFMLSSSGDPI